MLLLISSKPKIFFLDGSKQRQKLRSKISSEKEKLKDLVDKYNRLVAERDQVKLDDVENGNFSWKAEVSGGDGRCVWFSLI